MKIGIYVACAICGRQKKPRGRSAPMEMMMCTPRWMGGDGCDGYDLEPRVGDLWPRESEEDFGYPVGDDGTRESLND